MWTGPALGGGWTARIPIERVPRREIESRRPADDLRTLASTLKTCLGMGFTVGRTTGGLASCPWAAASRPPSYRAAPPPRPLRGRGRLPKGGGKLRGRGRLPKRGGEKGSA